MIRNPGPFSQRQGILPWGCPGISGPISPFIRALWGMRQPGGEVLLARWLLSSEAAAPACLPGSLGSPPGSEGRVDGWGGPGHGRHFRRCLGARGVCLANCCHCCSVAQSCPTLCDPVDCSLPGSSVHGILQVRILEWVAISFCRGSSPPRGGS